MFAVVVILMMFYDWRECVLSVFGSTQNSPISAAVLTLGNKACIVRAECLPEVAQFLAPTCRRTCAAHTYRTPGERLFGCSSVGLIPYFFSLCLCLSLSFSVCLSLSLLLCLSVCLSL